MEEVARSVFNVPETIISLRGNERLDPLLWFIACSTCVAFIVARKLIYISGRSRRVTPPLFSFRPLDTHKRFFADPRRPIDHVDS